MKKWLFSFSENSLAISEDCIFMHHVCCDQDHEISRATGQLVVGTMAQLVTRLIIRTVTTPVM
jgi:hypothetical protein